MRLVIASNRLPVTLSFEQGFPKFNKSVGGLATGLQSFVESLSKSSLKIDSYCWVGWPGEMPDNADQAQIEDVLKQDNLNPVYLSKDEVDEFYYGFCNSAIWPLFHNITRFFKFKQSQWEAYIKVNKLFTRKLLEIIQPNDLVWIHDYHLLLLPEMLRTLAPEAKIGFFLHIPFPSNQNLRLFPNDIAKSILKGLTGANLIGFHTENYRSLFLETIEKELRLKSSNGFLNTKKHISRTGVFPISINTELFQKRAQSEEVQSLEESLRNTYGNYKIILSMDRLDYTKGIIERLNAYEHFLTTYPQWREKVKMVMVLVPSRSQIESYQLTKQRIEALAGLINNQFKTKAWQPIDYKYESLEFNSIVAHYCLADVALVTPLIDGMNLIAKEYVASKVNKPGVLILSQAAGAAKELTQSLIIDPKNLPQVSNAIYTALNMNLQEQINRLAGMQKHLLNNDVYVWADSFLSVLSKAGALHALLSAQLAKAYSRISLNAVFLEQIYQGRGRLSSLLHTLHITNLVHQRAKRKSLKTSAI